MNKQLILNKNKIIRNIGKVSIEYFNCFFYTMKYEQ